MAPAPAIASQRNSARYSNSSNPSRVSSESTSLHLAALMATIIVTPKAPADIRVNKPNSRNSPPKNSIPDVRGVKKCGKGIPQPTKFSVTCERLLSLPQPLKRNTQPTVIRANRGASHIKCWATRSGQAISQSISSRIAQLLGGRPGALRCHRFRTQQIHRRLVKFGPNQKPLICTRDVTDGDLHTADDGLYVDA